MAASNVIPFPNTQVRKQRLREELREELREIFWEMKAGGRTTIGERCTRPCTTVMGATVIPFPNMAETITRKLRHP